MLEAVVQLLFSTVVLFFVVEIVVTAALGFKMIRRAYLNHLSDHNWRLALLSVGLFLMADAFNDTFWAWHLTQADTMQQSPEFFWSLVPAIVVSAAAFFMAWAFYTRADFFEAQMTVPKKAAKKEEE